MVIFIIIFISLFSRISTLIDPPSHPQFLTIPTIPTSYTNPLTFMPCTISLHTSRHRHPHHHHHISEFFFVLFFPHNPSAENLWQMIKHLPSSASPLFVPSPLPYQLHPIIGATFITTILYLTVFGLVFHTHFKTAL